MFEELKNHQEQNEPPPWLVTFVDLMGVLLAFFVLLFSMRAADVKQWKSVQASLAESFSGEGAAKEGGPQAAMEMVQTVQADGVGYIASLFQQRFAQDPVWHTALTAQSAEGDALRLALPIEVLYEQGSAGLSGGGQDALLRLGEWLSRLENRVEVHVFGGGEKSSYPSAWELAALRAGRAADALQSVGVGETTNKNDVGGIVTVAHAAESFNLAQEIKKNQVKGQGSTQSTVSAATQERAAQQGAAAENQKTGEQQKNLLEQFPRRIEIVIFANKEVKSTR